MLDIERKILLRGMPDELMLIIECKSTVYYENQVGGVTCWRENIEGVLAPVDVAASTKQQIQDLPYAAGAAGISMEIADKIDLLLSSEAAARYLKVDRSRINDSWEAWIYVVALTPKGTAADYDSDYFGSPYGFETARGVLTWVNSD